MKVVFIKPLAAGEFQLNEDFNTAYPLFSILDVAQRFEEAGVELIAPKVKPTFYITEEELAECFQVLKE